MGIVLWLRPRGKSRFPPFPCSAAYPQVGLLFLLSSPLVCTFSGALQRLCPYTTATISAGSGWTILNQAAAFQSPQFYFTSLGRRGSRVVGLSGGFLIRNTSSASQDAAALSLLWEEYFSDPTQWRDHRLTKNDPRYPDFRHRRSQDVLWVNNWGNPAWVAAELGTSLRDMCVYGGHPYDSDVGRLCHTGRLTEALQVLDLMRQRGIRPIPDTFACVLLECSRQNALSEGRLVHELMVKSGWSSNKYLQRHLISMYASCQTMIEARKVFASILERHVFAWAALIGGYLRARQYKEAINCFHQMRSEGSKLNKLVFFYILTACSKLRALAVGKQVHSLIIKSEYSAEKLLESSLQDMYIKCGTIQDARAVFDGMKIKDVITWNAMITAYSKQGQSEEALKLFQLMQSEGVKPDSVTLVCILKACTGVEKFMDSGKWVHGLIMETEYEKHVQTGTALIAMYFSWGNITEAKRVFEMMPRNQIVPCTAMMNGYVQHGCGQEALKVFQDLQDEGVEVDSRSLLAVLGACSSSDLLQEGRKVHALVVKKGLESDLFLGTALVTMYARCGSLESARQIFDKLPSTDTVLWNAMLTAYAKYGLGSEALNFFKEMTLQGLNPDDATFISLFNACANVECLDAGRQARALFLKSTVLSSTRLQNALLNMYAKCRQLEEARSVFNEMAKPDVVAWTTIIKSYVQNGQGEEAIKLFKQLQHEGVQLDPVFYVSVLEGCACIAARRVGKIIHVGAIKCCGELDISVENALLSMYIRCGSLYEAQQVFLKMSKQDVVSWTSMINGYVQHGHFEEALDLFKDMRHKGVKPNKVTFLCTLNACGSIADLGSGKTIHGLITKSEFVQDTSVCNALVDMYAKCGSIREARQVFDEILSPDLISWNTMILAFSHLGFENEALQVFGKMEETTVKPNHITFEGVLRACSRLNLVDEGCQYFDIMVGKYGIQATDDHCSCIVYLLGRSGRLEDAKDFVSSLPYKPGSSVWKALLDVGRVHGDAVLAKKASCQIAEQEFQGSAYSCKS